MKNAVFLGIVLIFIMSCQQTKQTNTTSEEYQAEVKQQITQVDKLFYEAWENKDLDSTLSFLDEGFLNMFSFGMTNTKEQCREGFPDVFDTYSIEDVEFKSVELIVDQDYAFETQLFKQKWITNDKQDTIPFDMRIFMVFKRQEDGNWKLFRNIGQQ
jgi:ketosteroid isomerase-like protein